MTLVGFPSPRTVTNDWKDQFGGDAYSATSASSLYFAAHTHYEARMHPSRVLAKPVDTNPIRRLAIAAGHCGPQVRVLLPSVQLTG